MTLKYHEFGNGNKVRLWGFEHSDGEMEYGVAVERDSITYCELECEDDRQYATVEYFDQIKIMEDYLK